MKIKNMCIIMILLLSFPACQAEESDTDFIARPFDQSALDLDNNAIDTGWDNVSYFKALEELGDNGYVKFATNNSHIFSLFAIDSTKEWVAIEFGAYDEFCMVDGNDGWTFYIDQSTGNVEGFDELYTGSAGPPEHDAVNHLQYEVVQKDGYHLIEIVRAFDTGDSQDLTMADGDLWNVKFASSTHHAKGGLDNPTEFGPSDIYFLSIQTGAEVVIPTTPERVDYGFWKAVIFFSIFIAAAIFVITHTLIRQVFRPLQHPNPIVGEDFKRPTLKSRWDEAFGSDNKEKKKPVRTESSKLTGSEVEA